MNTRRLISYRTVALILFVLVVSVSSAVAKTHRPKALKMEKYVRIDMACPQTAPGISAAFPVEDHPVNILNEEEMNWYLDNVFSDEFLDAYEFRRVAGRYVCFAKGSHDPVRLNETVFPPALGAFFKSVIQQSNTGVYSDLGLKEKLDCLAISGKGLSGQDMTSMLNIPFRTSRNATIKKDYEDIEGMTIDIEDSTKFDVAFSNPDDDINENTLADYFKDTFLSPGNITLRADFVFGGTFDSSVASISNRSRNSLGAATRTINMQTFTTGPVGMTDMVTSLASNRSITTAAWFETSTTHKIQLQGWPFAGSKGWCDLSSFSEIGELSSAGGSPPTSSTKPATMIYITPLSAVDEGLASLAIRRELIRALRTRWLFTEKPGAPYVPPVHNANFTRALLRCTPVLWEYLAHNNGMESLKWANAYQSVGPIPRDRMSKDYSAVLGHLMRPSLLIPSLIKLPDYHRESYYFPFDRGADNYYATAVYVAWKELFNNKALDKLLSPVGLKDAADKRRVDKVARAIIDAIFSGYLQDTKTIPVYEQHKQALLKLYPTTTETQLRSKYGINIAGIREKFTDLEWIANCIEPYPAVGTSGVPSTVLTGTATLVASTQIDNCGFTPIMYPFSPIRNFPQGRNILAFVKGQPAVGGDPATEGITSIEGLPFTSAPPNTWVIDVDPAGAKKLKDICNAFFNNNFTSIPAGTSTTRISTWTSTQALEATSSTTDAIKRLGYYRLQQLKKDAAMVIIDRIVDHQNMGNDETAILVKKKIGTGLKKIPVFEAAPGLNTGGADSPAALYCSIFGPVHAFLDNKYNGTAKEKIQNLFTPGKKKFFDQLTRQLAHEPKDCPKYYFSQYVKGEKIKEDSGGDVVWNVHDFVRRTKELAQKLGHTVVFRTKAGTVFTAQARRDY